MASFIAIILAAYLVGSFPTAIIFGKLIRGFDFDIRSEGSGNAGGTNVFRVLGWQAGLAVTIIDMFKGFAATMWLWTWQPFGTPYVDPTVLPIVTGIAAVLGHIWTIFSGFRGGKGVGTAAGMLIALYPIAAVVSLVVFVVTVYLTRYVSVGSMTAAVSLPIVLLISERFFQQELPDALFQFSIAVAVLIIYTHRQNIKRLLEGTENRFGRKRQVAQF